MQTKVVIFIFLRKTKILIEKRILDNFEGDQYLIPGGIAENAESIEKALKREMLEELGIIPLEFVIVPLIKKIRGLKNQLLIPFLINKWQGDFPKVILDKGNLLEWIEIDEVLKSEVKPTREIILALKKHLSI